MKKIILAILLTVCSKGFTYEKTDLLCYESNNPAAVLAGEYFKASNESKTSFITLTINKPDGKDVSEKLEIDGTDVYIYESVSLENKTDKLFSIIKTKVSAEERSIRAITCFLR